MKPKRILLLGGVCVVLQGHALAQHGPHAIANDHGGANEAMSAAAPASQTASIHGGRQAREWTRYPLIEPVMSCGERDRNAFRLRTRNSEAAALDIYAPDLALRDAHRQVTITPQGTTVSKLPGSGNYYWIVARDDRDGRVSVASTAVHFSDDGPAPTRLLLARKNELEIIPQPLPREHGSYRESEKWKFLLRYNGQPLTGATLRMETEFGTRTAFTSNEDGEVTVLFPRDFKPARQQAERGGRQRGRFVLVAEHEADGKRYMTAFNHAYAADPDRGRSLGWGAAFGLLGMVAAAPLLRRRVSKEGQGGTHA